MLRHYKIRSIRGNKGVLLILFILVCSNWIHAQEKNPYYYETEIGLDIAPNLFGAQGGSLLIKRTISAPSTGKWTKTKQVSCVPGAYRFAPAIRSFSRQKGDSTITYTDKTNENYLFFLIGAEKCYTKKRFSFNWGGDLIWLQDRGKYLNTIEILEPGVFHEPQIKKGSSNNIGLGISILAGCKLKILDQFSIGIELHLSSVLEKITYFSEKIKTNKDQELVSFAWPQLLYFSYQFMKKPLDTAMPNP